jgi:hypothetical protein
MLRAKIDLRQHFLLRFRLTEERDCDGFKPGLRLVKRKTHRWARDSIARAAFDREFPTAMS